MEVGLENFSDVLAYLENTLLKIDPGKKTSPGSNFTSGTSESDVEFVAIDLEMTGLRLPNEVFRPTWQYTELLPQQYERMRATVKQFDIM